MKKMLIVCTRFPFPANGGDKLRIVSNINYLKKKYKIDICYIGYEKINYQNKINNIEKIFQFNIKKKKIFSFNIKFFLFKETFANRFIL